jgi:hypothetical protein
VANYGITNSTNFAAQPNTVTTYTPLVVVAASSGSFVNAPTVTGLRRSKIYDILVGTNGTPADNFIEWNAQRATVGSSTVWAGSVSSVSSQFALDPADAGFASFVTVNTTAPSSTLFTLQQPIWYEPVNQRASYRWVAAPGSELIIPAVSSGTGSNGIAFSIRSGGYTGTAGMTILFQEQ